MKRYGYALLNLSHSLLRFSLFSFLWIYAVSFSAWAQTASTEAQIDEVLTLLDEGSSIENRVIDLRDILFEFDSPDLTPTTRPYLDKVVTLMQRVPNIQVEISGHTDNVGNADYNLGLSGKRADRVRTYLVDAGIASERITAVGLGDTQPLVENTTAVGRAKNRRVEMQIIKPEAVANIQDLIVLISGDTIGGKVLSATEEGVRYRSFLKDEEGFLKPGTVKKVIYASGEVWYAPKPVIPAEPAVVKTKKSWEKPAFLHSVETFEQGTVIVQATYEFASNLADSPLPYKTQSLPAMGLTIDKSVGANVGLGITLAGRWWGDPTLAYNFPDYHGLR